MALEIKREDIMADCARCSGTGRIDERRRLPGQPGAFERQAGFCPDCDGKGVQLTEAGRVLVELVERFGR